MYEKNGSNHPNCKKTISGKQFFLLLHSIYCLLHNVTSFLDATIEMLQGNGPPCSQRETVDCFYNQWRVLRTKYISSVKEVLILLYFF